MICNDEIIEANIRYCKVSNEWFVGTNETSTETNAVLSKELLEETIIIPRFVDNHQITQIGQFAFYKCDKIINVIIDARITCINKQAFSRCFNMKFIRLPNTLKFIYYCGISLCNSTVNPECDQSIGETIVAFEPNTNLEFLHEGAFSWRTSFIFYLTNNMNPNTIIGYIARETFYRVRSPFSVSFCGTQSEYVPYAYYSYLLGNKICSNCLKQHNLIFDLNIFVFILFIIKL